MTLIAVGSLLRRLLGMEFRCGKAPSFLHSLMSVARRQPPAGRFGGALYRKVNLCCGSQRIPGYVGVDLGRSSDVPLDLTKEDLPFSDGSMDAVVCISGINYFTRERGGELIRDVYRILRPGGIARFAVQDMESLARRYVDKDTRFFFQKLKDGTDRFPGPTLGDKFVSWFYGYAIKGNPCRYFYDFESLAYLFKVAGFSMIERKAYLESRLHDIKLIDNREEQMFFLEAIK